MVVSGPNGSKSSTVALSGGRATVGRLPDVNDIALQPDPEKLVTRAGHCSFEREGSAWFVVDGGSVNGTYLRRRGEIERVTARMPLQDGDAICVLASVDPAGETRYFELVFHATVDTQATRAVVPPPAGDDDACLDYDATAARLVLVRNRERHELRIRAQAHRLVAYMAGRNGDAGEPVLCTHDELMHAVWGDEPLHSREELAKLVWELRKKLEPFGAGELIENERRLGYRLRTCPPR